MENQTFVSTERPLRSTTIKCMVIKLCLILVSFSPKVHAQSQLQKIARNLFLPAIDIGYIINPSKALSNGIFTKTSIEYRFTNQKKVFLRLNYDFANIRYRLENVNTMTNVIEGKTGISDLILGGGYRFGNKNHRIMVMAQGGPSFYNYPMASHHGKDITIEAIGKRSLISRISAGYEYYFDQRSAIMMNIFLNNMWSKSDFWVKQPISYGISIGFITALN